MLRYVPLLALLAMATGASAVIAPAAAQSRADSLRVLQRAGVQGLSPDQVLEQLRSSGLTREQARARLEAAGYDPSLADPYFDQIEGRGGSLPGVEPDFLRALAAVGLMGGDGARADDEIPDAEAELAERQWRASGVADSLPRVFGLELFSRATQQFSPPDLGPVDPDYRLGPRDQIVLILTGDVELAYSLDVTREGFIVIPDVGQVSVNGLTLEGLRERLFDRLGRVYSGVKREADATTRFDLSLGRLRTNQVFVIGDVARPGAYQVSAVSRVLTALYRGGGPTENGSFRRITVQRGGRLLAEVDLYEYLLRGDASKDIRLEQGDVVFVPPVGPQVTAQGKVRRPGIFEVVPGESLSDVVRFSGGFLPDAHVQRIQVDRILPPGEREPGRDRTLLDADVEVGDGQGGDPFPVRDGDRITVFGVLEKVTDRVALVGAVWRPGTYEYTPGMTIGELIQHADGLLPSAYTPVAHIRRLIPETGASRLIRVPLTTGSGGGLADVPLADMDSVLVFDIDVLRTADSVRVLGEVRNPGKYPLDADATVEDLILSAGGFTPAAEPFVAQVARPLRTNTRTDTLSINYRVGIEAPIPTVLEAEAYGAISDRGPVDGQAATFRLFGGDQIIVRRLAGWVDPAYVTIQGQVASPGPYALGGRAERLSSLVARAGGTVAQSDVKGSRLLRDSIPIAIDLVAALANPGSTDDIELRSGDVVTIPSFDPTVTVAGTVIFPIRVLHEDGLDVGDYLSAAGGAAGNADLDRVSVEYANGRRAVAKKFLFHRSFPPVEPGSRIFVPAKEEGSGTNWDSFFTRLLGVSTTLVTILAATGAFR